MAMELRPDVVVMDINMPGMDGVAAAEIISQRLPTSPIIMMSVHGEAEQLKRSITRRRARVPGQAVLGRRVLDQHPPGLRARARPPRAGWSAMPAAPARRRPLDAADLGEHQVIGVFSPKGGAGRTTIATNLALALQRETGGRVCLVDANLQFGDVGVLLNLNPKNRSMLDAVDGGEPDARDHQLGGHRPLDRHPRPAGPALAGGRRPGDARPTCARWSTTCARPMTSWWWTCPSALNDHSLAIMDAADQIVVLTALEITTIKNVRLFLEVADQLEYDRSKIRLVVNRSDSAQGIRIADVEASIRRSIDGTIVSDGRLAVLAVNRGVPFVVSHPDGALSRDVVKLARTLAGDAIAAKDKPNKRGLFARR